MPILIEELVLKAVIAEQNPANRGDREMSNQTSSRLNELTEAEKVAKEILDILKRKNER